MLDVVVMGKVMGFVVFFYIIGGLLFYGVGMLFWFFVLCMLDLLLVYFFVVISFIVVFLIGIFGLGELFNVMCFVGLLIIILGFVVMVCV